MRRHDGERILRQRFEDVHGRKLDIDHPKTLTAKLTCWMVAQTRRPDPVFTELADKVRVRRYVAERLGDGVLTRMLWNGPDPRAIPFDELPTRYVLKTNNGSRRVIRVSGEVDREAVIAQLQRWIRSNYYWQDREPQYLRIPPLALVEEWLDDGMPAGPLDYRFWCFHGEPAVIQVADHVHSINPYYDPSWRRLDLVTYAPIRPDADVPRPRFLSDMLRAAGTLSRGFGFVRVDLHCLPDRFVFGEMTFTPAAGTLRFHPDEWDRRLGALW
ncbi:MAG: ATP-grasp fold amidoligase family protein [Gemmatimonadota bacterium]|nr:ATP-grasp fold amidoligase family protein [Gemmatimonadota bacterium]